MNNDSIDEVEKSELIKTVSMWIGAFILVILFANGVHYPGMMKDRSEDNFESGLIFKDQLLKSKYEKIGSGNSLECFGGYTKYKMKNNKSVSFNTYLIVCD